MTRRRPARPLTTDDRPSTPYVTRAGYDTLQRELQTLWRERREVVAALSAAAAEGDRSENAEYIYGKKQLREIDRRVRFLRQRLEGMTVVDKPPSNRSRVFFGAWVTLEDDNGEEVEYRIVGPDEFDAAPGYISMDAPLGRALLRKALDDEVRVELPGGAKTYAIVAVRYEEVTDNR